MPAVCILGGGYAGVRVARGLAGRLDPTWTITLVDRSDCHQLITRLPEVVAGKIGAGDACLPFTRVLPRRVQHLRANVEGVDLEARLVRTSGGEIRPDVLVVAIGTAPNFLGIVGAEAHCLPVKTVCDAVHLRDSLVELRTRQAVVRVIIVGAGYTGTEVAGELSAREYRRSGAGTSSQIDVRIIAEDERLLPQASHRVSAAAERILRTRHVTLNLGQSVLRVNETGLRTASGTQFEADLVVWAAQTRVHIDVHGPTRQLTSLGKIAVDPCLSVEGVEAVFACGDASSAYDYAKGQISASSAQLALQEGDVVARNIDAMVRGQPLREYRPHAIGEALSLGGDEAVAEVGGLLLSGRAAAAVKRTALLRYLAGFSFPPIG